MGNFQPEILNENIGFALGTGRCGTHFIARVTELEPGMASIHERHPLNDTFHRYCKWYGIPVDHEGFLHIKAEGIQDDLKDHFFSFESSAYLSLSIQELYNRFKAKFILLIRSPEKVVNSYIRKGWYQKPAIRANPNLAPSYQNDEKVHFFLGRIMPSGEKFLEWNQMSRVGKLAWYWNALNAQVLKQFETIPETHWRVEKLEELSYNRYQDVAQFLGYQTQVTEAAYNQLVEARPGKKTSILTIGDWSTTQIAEFEAEVAPIAQRMGYEYRVYCLKK